VRSFRSSSIVFALGSSLGAACVDHAHLAPPPVDGSADARLAAYQALSPRGYGSFQNNHARDIGFLVLGDGTRVFHAEDLEPVVPAGSPTAVAGERHRSAWERAKHWFKISGVGFAAMIVVPSVALLTMRDSDARTEVAIGGAAAGVIVGWVGFIGGMKNTFDANGERASAFLTYDDALRAELSLCTAGLEVYDCATGPAVPRAPTAPVLGVAPEAR
jgi:hypothetical protein